MIKELSEYVEGEIGNHRFSESLPELYDPITYTLSLGGKRLRPLMLLLSARIFGVSKEKAIHQALGVEIFHNFTLVHDDVMDNAPLRRGKPSVYKKWDLNTAILSGDVMFSISMQEASKCDADLLPAVMECFLDMTVRVCEGQQFDMNFEDRSDVSMSEYLNMIGLKTAYLMAGSLKLGAILGRKDNETAQAMFEYGMKAGTAFQLVDDYLDAFGDPEKFGKQVGGDILEGKKTWLYIDCVQNLKEEDRADFIKVFNDNDLEDKAKVEKVKDYFRKAGSDNALLKFSDKLLQDCWGLMDKIDGDENAKKELINLTQKLTQREH